MLRVRFNNDSVTKSAVILKWISCRGKEVSSCPSLKLIDEMKKRSPPSEFELTAKTLRAHIINHGKLILKPLIYLTVNSPDDSHCKIAVSFV